MINFYDYIYLMQLTEVINEDLTLTLPNNLAQTAFNFNQISSPNPISNKIVNNIYQDKSGVYGTINFENNVPFYSTFISNYMDVLSDWYYTISYDYKGQCGELGVKFYDTYLSNNDLGEDMKFTDISALKTFNHFEHIIKVPSDALGMIITLNGMDISNYKNINVTEGIPQTIKDLIPIWTISEVGNEYLNNLSNLNISFTAPSATDLINKIRSLNVYNINRGLFYLTQLCITEILALNYYRENDKSAFNRLNYRDFIRIQHNLNIVKYMFSQRRDLSVLLNDWDNLLTALGYYQTAFYNSTYDLNFRHRQEG